jgi:PAS domain S-box-containing protein
MILDFFADSLYSMSQLNSYIDFQLKDAIIIFLIIILIAILNLFFYYRAKKTIKSHTDTIQNNEQLFRQITENIIDLVCQTDLNGIIQYASPSFKKILGYAPESLVGISFFEFVHPGEYDKCFLNFKESVKFRTSERIEFRFKTASEQYLWLDSISNILFDALGNPNGAVIGSRDISGRKLSEQILWKQLQLQHNLLSSIPALVYLKDTDLKYLEVNEKMAELLGIAKSEIIGKTDYDLYPEDTADIYYKTDIEVLTFNMTKFNIEALFHTGNGKNIWVSTSKLPFYDSFGNIVGLAGVSMDITEKKQAEKELIEAKLKAEESDSLKTAFLANMSHEIRTPLNGIIGFAGLLQKPNLEKEKLVRYSHVINASSLQLLAIINDIIDISKIESGQLTLNKVPFQLNRTFEEIFSVYKELAEKKSLSIELKLGLNNEQSRILADELKIKQILGNLLNNAIKFTYEGKIETGYTFKDDFLEFYVKDTGIGISQEFQQSVFERFRQAEIHDVRKFGGTGLGLSISKALVKMLGGKIWFYSDSVKGTTFYFTIPFLYLENAREINNQKNIENNKHSWRNKSILIAEDEETNLLFIKELLNESGINIFTASDGVQAVEIFKLHSDIDLVVLDIKMPELDGYEVLKIIKKTNPEVKIIAQTAYAMSDDKMKAFGAGFDFYLPKPIDKREFFMILEKCLS